MIQIADFVRGLVSIPEEKFSRERVLDYITENRVDPASLAPYLYFSSEHYTRNLIEKTALFELIAICWEIGQRSPIHNHCNQRCWMALPYGKLQVHNFAVVRKDPSIRYCELRSDGRLLMDTDHPTEVNPEEPIHEVSNLPSFRCRAVSLHIYSRPFDTCEVYDLKKKVYQDVPLVNTSEYGVLKDLTLHPEKVLL